MTAQEISDAIYAFYAFEGDTKEWLAIEAEMRVEIDKFSEAEIELLTETEAMEHLLMICDGIRFANGENDERNSRSPRGSMD